jgi:SEC-C motif/Dolichyl-phosphate-mannose-protein mannosyltransferase
VRRMSSAKTEKLLGLAAAALVLVFLLQAFLESRLKSPSSDEPPHIAAGLSYWQTHTFRANPQHPPLMKELAGLSLLLSGVRWPHNAETEHLIHGELKPGEQPEWAIGNQLIASNGPDRVMMWARAPLLLVAAMLAVVLFLWGRQLAGAVAAVGAVLLYTMDPTVLGHSYLVTTDVGVTAFLVLFLFALWNYVRQPGRKGLALCGLALGALLCSKFSAVLILPVIPVLLLVGRIRPAGAEASVPAGPRYRAGRNDPCPCGSGKKFKACHGAPEAQKSSAALPPDLWGQAIPCLYAFLGMCLVAVVVIQAIYLFSTDPFLYIRGLLRVNADHIKDYPIYFAGRIQDRFLSYFVYAWLLKEPIATIILAGIGLATVLRSKSMPVLAKWFLLLPPAVMFLGAMFLADEVGVRYVMPAFPFGHLLGGIGMAALLRMTAMWARAAAVVLCAWVVVAAFGVYPDHLPYFNESACLLRDPSLIGLDGGTRCGALWLDDSNVDWGQSLKQLKTWLDANAPGREVLLSNTFAFPAEVYGIRYRKLEPADLAVGPQAGLYAVTAHMVARIPAYPGASDWLRHMPPLAMAGHSIYIYDMAPAQRPSP